MNYPGFLIRRERLRRSWSQEGLCKGVCAVSYLSKIERGEANVSPEIVALLLARLGLPWYDDAASLARARALAADGYEALYSGEKAALADVQAAVRAEGETLLHGPLAPGLLLLLGYGEGGFAPLEEALEPCLTREELALQRALQCRFAEALRLHPTALYYQLAGTAAYAEGRYAAATELLQAGHDLAAREGRVQVMALCRVMLGNCCSDRGDLPGMEAHYAAASRLARALGDGVLLETLRYNAASTRLEQGDWQSALAYFAARQDPDALTLHKLAICREKAGEREQALAALDRAESGTAALSIPEQREVFRQMCAVVRTRLTTPDYLHSAAYGEQLLACFAACRRELSAGYARFHLPWVLEWYTANRQYKQAYELMADFADGFPE